MACAVQTGCHSMFPGAWAAVPAVPAAAQETAMVAAPVPAVGVPGTVPAPAGDVLGALEAAAAAATAVPVPAGEAARTPVRPAVPETCTNSCTSCRHLYRRLPDQLHRPVRQRLHRRGQSQADRSSGDNIGISKIIMASDCTGSKRNGK